MSLLAIAGAVSSIFPAVHFQAHKHGRKGESGGDPGNGQVGQLPVGVGQNLLRNLLHSLQQTMAGQPITAATGTVAATAVGSATTGVSRAMALASAPPGAGFNPGVAQDLHGFVHALFQALRQDGLGSVGAPAAATATAGGIGATGSQYAGGIVSSLQTLIQQLSASGPPTPATANLNNAFNQLTRDFAALGTNAGQPAAALASAPATASLQNLLNDFLHNLQDNARSTPVLVGTNVNATA